jgi:hypothetical protein
MGCTICHKCIVHVVELTVLFCCCAYGAAYVQAGATAADPRRIQFVPAAGAQAGEENTENALFTFLLMAVRGLLH